MIQDQRDVGREPNLDDIRNFNSEISIPRLFLMTNSFETGGSERQFVALAHSLNCAKFRVEVGCILRGGALLEEFGRAREFSLGGSLYGAKSLWTRLRLADHLRRNSFAIAHAFDFYTNLTLIPAARLAGVPVVIGSHRQLGDLLSRTKLRAQVAALRLCDAVVCNSRAAADRVVEQGLPLSRVVAIGNGLSPSCFADTSPALSRRPGLLRVGMIARMNSASKNHAMFLRAAARIRNKVRNVEFILIGDGPLRLQLEHKAEELGVSGSVTFLGERQDIPALLASLDVSVLPSFSESLSNAILESMAAGVPVVATRVGGHAELLSPDRGILVAPGNENALANAIELLLSDAMLRSRLSSNARKFAEANFTLEQMRQRYEDLYAELLGRKTWRPDRRWSFDSASPPGARLRIALIAASPRYVGGQSVQAEQLARNWQDDSAIDARFIPIDPDVPRRLRWAEGIPFLRTLIREPVYLVSLWRGLKDVDIAHIFSASYWSFWIAPAPAWLIARLLKKKTLIHYHSGEAPDHLRRFRGVRPVLADADCLAVPSSYLAEVFREFGLNAKVVPNIVDLKQFAFRKRAALRPRLICTRGFHSYYCVDLVVQAFAEIQRAFPEASLDLVGKGPQESQIRKLVGDLKLSGVRFRGVVPHAEIAQLYATADIFINASYLDNMPVSILEAFAAGPPVVTTAPEGMSYLVEHERTGLLSAPGDSLALAENVVRLLRDPDLAARLALNAHEEVKRYSWENIRQRWLGTYHALMLGENVIGSESISDSQMPQFRSR